MKGGSIKIFKKIAMAAGLVVVIFIVVFAISPSKFIYHLG
jgi:hypothetical protein